MPHLRPITIRRFAGQMAALLALMLLAIPSLQPAAPAAEPDAPESNAEGADATPSNASSAASTSGGALAAAVPAYRQADHLVIIPITGVVDEVTDRSIERRLREAQAAGADAVVIELDTPGGRMDVTLDICTMLKDRPLTPANVVAWVRPKAYSAGTIIALATREIVVSSNATFGDAAPIQGLPLMGLIQMAPAERAKVEAPLLAEVIDSARRNGYDENLVQAFVAVGLELWMLQNIDTGERVIVTRDEYERVMGEEPEDAIPSVTPSASPDAPVVPFSSRLSDPSPSTGSSAPPDPEQVREQVREDIFEQQQLPPTRRPLTADDRGQYRTIGQIISDDRLLTVKSDEGIFYGLAVQTIDTDAELAAFFGQPSIVERYEETWSEELVRFLINPVVRIVLIVIFVVGLFIEMAAPGLGVFGGAAVVALLLLVAAPALAGLAQWWDIVLIAIGLVLIAAELFVIPGVGIAGFGGAVCLLIGLVGSFVSGSVSTPQGQDELMTGVLSVLGAVIAASIAIWLISRQIGSIPALQRLTLRSELSPSRPIGAGADADGASTSTTVGRGSPGVVNVGDAGVAETDLRPSGRATIGGRIIDVQSATGWIEQGTPVRVISVGRFEIKVEPNTP